jgi:hypothetical protein
VVPLQQNGSVGSLAVLRVGGDTVDSSVNTGSAALFGRVLGDVVKTDLESHAPISMFVGGSMTRGTRLFSGSGNVIANVGGHMMDSSIVATSEHGQVTGRVQGNMSNSQIDSHNHVSVWVGGAMRDSHVTGRDSQSVGIFGPTVGAWIAGDVDNSSFVALENETPNARVDLTVGGSFNNSEAQGRRVSVAVHGDSVLSAFSAKRNFSVDVNGDMICNQLFAGEPDRPSVVEVDGKMGCTTAMVGESHGLIARVRGAMINSKLASDKNLSLMVGGNMQHSAAVSTSGNVSFFVNGNMVDSQAVALERNSFAVIGGVVGGDYTRSTVLAARRLSLIVGGDFGSTAHVYDGDMRLYVDGKMMASGVASASDAMHTRIGAGMDGALQAYEMDVNIGGSVGATGSIQAAHIRDMDDDDNLGFYVSEDFNGRLDVAESFDTGAQMALQTLVGGTVGR